jgi:DNA-binding response OmpR family regulator
VVVTRDGNEAWLLLSIKETPQLAILDWMMPSIDGVEVCRKVRNEVHASYIYLFLLSCQQLDEDLVTGMEAGADDYITKPLKINELRRCYYITFTILRSLVLSWTNGVIPVSMEKVAMKI